MGVFAKLLRRNKDGAAAAAATEDVEAVTAEAEAAPAVAEAAEQAEVKAETVEIPKQQSAEEAADSEAGEGARQ
ncbi:gliding motility protein [Streptomyces sp. NPDC058740]|uniref:gliding motility protein n=1 Tax=unclassified Streptomyces TaxID=2593676 RepID=UPI00367CF557